MGLFGDLFGGNTRRDIRRGTAQATSSVNKGYGLAKKAINENYDAAAGYVSSYDKQASDVLKPSLETGKAFSDKYGTFMGLKGKEAQKAAYDDFEFSPGFQREVDYGQKVAERSAAARGYATTPRMMMELRDFGHRSLNEEYGNYLDRLERGADRGTTAATTAASIKSNTGGQLGNIMTSKGDQLAALHSGTYGTLANLAVNKASATANTRLSLGDLSGFLGTAMKAFAAGQ